MAETTSTAAQRAERANRVKARQRGERAGRVKRRQAQKQTDDTFNWLAENYGLTDALLDADPTDPASGFSMREAFDQIRREQITDGNRAAQIIAKTTWWQRYGVESLQRLSEKKRKGYWSNVSGTGVIDQRVNELRASFNNLGVTVPDGALRKIAEDAYVFGFNDQTIRNLVAKKASGKSGTGAEEKLRQFASQMGLNRSDDWYRDASMKIGLNQQPEDFYIQQLQQEAISRTPYWEEQIKAGSTVKDLAAGYLSDAQNLLEDSNIDLNDSLVKQALTSVGADGKPAPVPLWKFEQMARKDARWKQTKNAQNAYANIGMGVLKSFGFVE
jgi:hypothetical protein